MESLSYVTAARMPTEKAHGVSIAHMCAEFAAAGAAVSLIVPQRKNPLSRSVHEYYSVQNNFSVRFVPAPDLVGSGYLSPVFFLLQRVAFLFTLRRTPVPQGIVYTREPEIAWFFGKTHRAVFEAHRWPSGIAGKLQSWLVRHAALVVCNSRGTQTAAVRAGVPKTLVAPNGFDPVQFVHAPPQRAMLGLPEGILALYAGSDKPGKGAKVVREAAKQLGKGITVVSVGTNKKQALPPFLELGSVPQPEVPNFLMAADILLLPNTREGESVSFTSPIKLFEYLAAGKAIIASDLPSIREILSDGDAVFVPPGDSTALASAVGALAKDDSLRARLAVRAKALSASYTWGARAQRILATLGV